MRDRLSQWLRARVAAALAERQYPERDFREELDVLASSTDALRARLVAVRRGLEGVGADIRLLNAPFSAELTVDQAWRKHPHTRLVFARHHLPACDGCAVRFDETLAEAAEAYGLELSGLLEELNALL